MTASIENEPADVAGSMFRRGLGFLNRMIRLHPKSLAIAATSAMVFAAGTVGSAIVLGRITDEVVIPAFEEPGITTSTILWGVLALAAITVIRIVGTVGRRFFGMLAGEQVQRTYRQRLGEKYLRLPLSWHQKRPTGELLAHVDNDAEMATQVLMPLPFTIGVFFLTIFSGVSLVLVDPLLAAIAFALFPLLAFLNRLYSRRIEVPAARGCKPTSATCPLWPTRASTAPSWSRRSDAQSPKVFVSVNEWKRFGRIGSRSGF